MGGTSASTASMMAMVNRETIPAMCVWKGWLGVEATLATTRSRYFQWGINNFRSIGRHFGVVRACRLDEKCPDTSLHVYDVLAVMYTMFLRSEPALPGGGGLRKTYVLCRLSHRLPAPVDWASKHIDRPCPLYHILLLLRWPLSIVQGVISM